MGTSVPLVFHVNRFLYFRYLELSPGQLSQAYQGDGHLLLYVDRGGAAIRRDGCALFLQEGTAILLPVSRQSARKNRLSVAEDSFANVYAICFQLSAGDLEPCCGRPFPLSSSLLAYVKLLLKEAKFCYQNDLRTLEFQPLVLSDRRPFGSEQMLKTLMEQLLITLVRESAPGNQCSFELIREKLIMDNLHVNPYFDGILQYLEQHIGDNLTIEQICGDNLTNRSKLQRTFHTCTGEGVIACHQKMKIEYAKILIRKGGMNFTQISEQLAYSSVHHFSKKFKQLTNMTPSSYLRLVR